MAFRLLRNKGECDVDAFFHATPVHVWEEFKVANAIIDSFDAWKESNSKEPWKPPEFKPVTGGGRRRLSGGSF